MQRSGSHPHRLRWSLILASTILLISAGKAGAQYPGYGWGGGYPGVAYGYPGVGFGSPGMGYGFPGVGFGSPGMGYGFPGVGYGFPGFGYGYPAFGYGVAAAGPAYPGPVYVAGYPGPFTFWGYESPLFGVGLSPLGVQSYLYETRVLGRVPRASAGSYSAADRRY